MEKLKEAVPRNLKRRIAESTPYDLPSTCSSLIDFFHQLPEFYQMVRQLTDPEMALCRKEKDFALELKCKGNDYFVRGDYSKALRFYSQALRVAPADADDTGKNLVAMLYMNRASVLHKMGLLLECLRDCNRGLAISPSYAKVWYRRGKANVSLGNHEDAIRDLKVAMSMELSSGGKRQIESELKLIVDQDYSTNSSSNKSIRNKMDCLDELLKGKLQCVSTPAKGRGMVAKTDIPQVSLIHIEEPYAAIILKPCRETHCHFCLNELPADAVPCMSCATPLYCSQHCRLQAGGQKFWNNQKNCIADTNISSDLERYIAEIISSLNASDLKLECNIEHGHECQGVNWPAVLPSEIVLAGRILVKSMEKQKHFNLVPVFKRNLELCHNYAQLASETKLELLIYSVILLNCLQHFFGSDLLVNGVAVSECVILLSQIRINSIGIVRMKYSDVSGQSQSFSVGHMLTASMEQVPVGQAIYLVGSLFNHSCQPNIHAYFLSRALYIRSTEPLAAGCPVELSYGPQVGQWDFKDRQQLLEDQYSFKCQCAGCSELNLSDLVLNAFQCIHLNCFGIVLDNSVAKYERQRMSNSFDLPEIWSSQPQIQVGKLKNDISEVARHLFEQTSYSHLIEPGYCLNCGSYRDLKASVATVSEAEVCSKRLDDAIASAEVSAKTLSDAASSFYFLRSTLHAYNKKIAEVEDNLAQAFCLLGELQSARDHCKAAIEVLKKLYGPNHIVIGNELVKLVSIQLSLSDSTAMGTFVRLDAIFSRYYGPHADIIFPHLQSLKQEAQKLEQ